MDTGGQSGATTPRRSVEITWVPGTAVDGRPIMEMRWHVADTPPVVVATA